jgi:phage-related protein
MSNAKKDVIWWASSKKDLSKFPDDIQDVMGYGIYQAQIGQKHPDAKPLKGFVGGSVLEIIDCFDGDTYRCVYTVKFSDSVYVLHAFQKKSVKGIATPQIEIDLIKARLKQAEEHYRQWKEGMG